MTRARRLLFHVVWIAISSGLALLAAEAVLRTMDFSTGDGAGGAARRWSERHWQPVNAQGYRDVPWAPAGSMPAVVFLGDSFTEGHGVAFEETYYHRLRTRLAATHVAYSLGASGASTRDERAAYAAFRAATGVAPATVVHQYFGNDIGDLLGRPPVWKPWPGLATLSRHSELAELLWIYLEGVRWGRLYADHHFDAYRDADVFARHRADLGALVDDIHAGGARWVFVVFPFLDNETYLDLSVDAYVGRMRDVFLARCRPGDAFLDVAPVARAVPLPERTVNTLDGHPSPRLHALVAGRLAPLFDGGATDGLLSCPAPSPAPAPPPGA